MPDSPIPLLRAHARHAPWNARGLAAHVTSLVNGAGMRPTNAAARAEPSARAVRFYVASGLLDHPDGTGTAATYNYRHLLQLTFVKIRQREGQTLDRIKEELKELAGDASSAGWHRHWHPHLARELTRHRTRIWMARPCGTASPSRMALRCTFATTLPRHAVRRFSPFAKPSVRRWAARTFAKGGERRSQKREVQVGPGACRRLAPFLP